MLVLIGDNDIINNEKTVRVAKRILARGQGGVIPNAGHFVSVDRANIVNKKIIDFLKDVDEAE